MKDDLDRPADTRLMGIVHDALRRDLDRARGGTVIRQSFQVLSLRVWADRVIWALIPAHHDRLAALRADLARFAAIAEAEPTTKIKIKDEAERAGQLLT